MTMKIEELFTISDAQVADLLTLMQELSQNTCVDAQMLRHIEDVVVLSSFRGQGLGRQLMEHLIDYARRELVSVDMYLTSKPSRVAANALYRALGFTPKETNVYKMSL